MLKLVVSFVSLVRVLEPFRGKLNLLIPQIFEALALFARQARGSSCGTGGVAYNPGSATFKKGIHQVGMDQAWHKEESAMIK